MKKNICKNRIHFKNKSDIYKNNMLSLSFSDIFIPADIKKSDKESSHVVGFFLTCGGESP